MAETTAKRMKELNAMRDEFFEAWVEVDRDTMKNISQNFMFQHAEYLIEQAEQVQELERVNRQLKSNLSVVQGYYKKMIKISKDFVEEKERYREALEFYADEENYVKEEFKALNPNAKSIMMSAVEWDEGDKARQTLEESK